MINKYFYHFLIFILFIIVAVHNFQIREIYAEDLNKDNLLARIVNTEAEEIIETSDNQHLAMNTNTAFLESQLAAVNNALTSNNQVTDNFLPVDQDSSAIIKPNIVSSSKDSLGRDKTITYKVQPGDTVSSIASQFQISVNTILWENDLSKYSIIKPGDELKILPVNGVTHLIKKGETLSDIAQKYKIAVDEILEINDIPNAAYITAGQKIIIPGGKPLLRTRPRTKLASLKSFLRPRTAQAASGGRLNWPITCRRITQYYHLRHRALDIACPYGTAILAAETGTVERVGRNRGGYGKYIIINHDRGLKTLYAHLNKFYVRLGQRVERGTIIGTTGCTGRCTGPHVHFEVRQNNIRKNPLNYL